MRYRSILHPEGSLIVNLLKMRQRIHKRLPVEFVKEILEAFDSHKISEEEGMRLLGIKRSRLHQLRKRWLMSNKKKPFSLRQRSENAFHVLADDVKHWLDKELRYIRLEVETFRVRFNFALLAKEAERDSRGL